MPPFEEDNKGAKTWFLDHNDIKSSHGVDCVRSFFLKTQFAFQLQTFGQHQSYYMSKTASDRLPGPDFNTIRSLVLEI